MHFPSPHCVCVLVLLGAGGLMAAHAAAPPPAQTSAAARRAAVRAPAPQAAAVPGLGASVGNSQLSKLTGGSNTYQTITLNGNVSDTSTTDVATGFNEIGGGAFANAVGFPMVIQNSGNSVLIQNATIINVQMQP